MVEKVLGTKVTRESNFELLRLVCMFFILVLHVNNGGLFKDLGDIGQSIPASIFESFCIVAVNCFVLISGYFEIKFNWKSFVHLFIFCFSYTFGFAVLFSLYRNEILLKRIILSFFTFSHSPYWFVNVYFGLFLFSPILNNLIKDLTKYDFLVYLIILTIVNVYLGFYTQNGRFNDSGYNIMNFIYLYFIGRYINLYGSRRGGGGNISACNLYNLLVN
jgi:surface polysaccharide O-acyltransferase-like enzyme